MNELTIGKLAKEANIHVETVRYYERRGLIPRARRTVANYRLYSPENLRQVKFVKQAQALGFSLKEIKKLLTLRATPRARCAEVRAYASQKIKDIDARIHSLASMRKALQNCVTSAQAKDRQPNVRFLNRSIRESDRQTKLKLKKEEVISTKRKVEIFSAGCPVCQEAIELVNRVACASCDVTVLDMKDRAVADRAKALGVRSLPAIVVNGNLAGCCSGQGINEAALRAEGIGQPIP